MLFEDRARAESFGSVARLYDRARPTYPPALVDWLLPDGARRVLDIGCGTGIAGALFAQRGCEVTGVEVDARMAVIARTKGLDVEVASFERWEDRGRRFELAISAQAWHWIEPRAGAAKAAAVLRDGGRIACFWNVGDPPAHVFERLDPIYDRLGPKSEGLPVVLGRSGGRGEETAAALNESELFEPAEIHRFQWSRAYTTDEWLELISTHSDHQALGEAGLEALRDAVGAELDALGGSFQYPYETLLVTAQVCSASHGYRAVSWPA
jgi:SAM-dependent methyltransferase